MKDSSLSHFDPRSPVCEQEVQKIIHLQNIENQMPDAFTDSKRITKSHIPEVNVSTESTSQKDHLQVS